MPRLSILNMSLVIHDININGDRYQWSLYLFTTSHTQFLSTLVITTTISCLFHLAALPTLSLSFCLVLLIWQGPFLQIVLRSCRALSFLHIVQWWYVFKKDIRCHSDKSSRGCKRHKKFSVHALWNLSKQLLLVHLFNQAWPKSYYTLASCVQLANLHRDATYWCGWTLTEYPND